MNSPSPHGSGTPLEREKSPPPQAIHILKVPRKSKNESSSRKRRATTLESYSRDSAFSFIARSASMYRWVVVGHSWLSHSVIPLMSTPDCNQDALLSSDARCAVIFKYVITSLAAAPSLCPVQEGCRGQWHRQIKALGSIDLGNCS